MNLHFSTIYQLMSSNEVKVEDENSMLGFLFHYTKVQSLRYGDSSVEFIVDLLA